MIFDELKQRAQSPELWTGDDLKRLPYLLVALEDAKDALVAVRKINPVRSHADSVVVMELVSLIHHLSEIEHASVMHKVHLESMTGTTPPNTH